MEKEFVTYEQALSLKELGFNEKCIAYFDESKRLEYSIIKGLINSKCKNNDITTPLKQQVFSWFREKHGIKFHIREDIWNDWCYIKILVGEEYTLISQYKSFEEAELGCIDELIKLVKNK